MCKFYFTNRVVDQQNSLPNRVITANNIKIFKKRLDQYWQHQDIIFDFRAQIELNWKLQGSFESKYCLIYNVLLYYLPEKLAKRHIACASTSSTSTSYYPFRNNKTRYVHISTMLDCLLSTDSLTSYHCSH